MCTGGTGGRGERINVVHSSIQIISTVVRTFVDYNNFIINAEKISASIVSL